MGIDKPLISILMAVYEPRMDWLRQQLASLNEQTYPNLRLYIRDDCSSAASYEQVRACAQECITHFPYTITRNEKNLGSNGTFELLTREADGELFAYCDQDDVWLPEKLTVLQEAMEREQALVVCSDMYIIDGEGRQVADSITKVRRHHVFRSGTDLARGLLTSNFAAGCTMLVRAESAKQAIPFCPYMVHDHYITLFCAARGMVYSSPEKTIRYRIHGGNQTGIMSGVRDKESYLNVRISAVEEKLRWLEKYFPYHDDLNKSIHRRLRWVHARKENWQEKGHASELWQLRDCGRQVTLYEILAARLPEKLFMRTINLARKNVI